ncbi:ABC transporter permease [Actinosynnema sp. ALI-1.44]|uniref:carbohydrate ABC transporter permease n=1 Tax=Actinosynnema sp. ALI-1.44 TaxID=1933779 RepID=UPI00097CB8F0|nr:sugar ABC transporter permease [Actinosynnema sp. ALI-1.44]ONI79714.1 ABC transporter permease [Actinosynnema sp. ALI-1.44]
MTTSLTTPPASGRKPGAGGSTQAAHITRRKKLFWPFLIPTLVLYGLFLIVPTVATVVLSFSNWKGAGDTPQFNGFKQYAQIFADDGFQSAFVNTLIYITLGGVGTFVLAFLFTMVLRDMRGNKMVRAILFFPNIVAPVALGMFFGVIYRYQPNRQGLANFLLESVGLSATKFLEADSVTWVVLGSIIWASAGFYITILMAAVDRIPPYLYEDASIAGASPWQKFRNITLPLTWDVVGIAGVLWTINAVKIFELVFVMAGSGTYAPPIHTWTLGIFVFDRSFGDTPAFGTACACAVVMIALVSVFVVALRRLMRRDAIQF